MGGSYSKNSFFDEPKEYQTVKFGNETFWYFHGKKWRIRWSDVLFSHTWRFVVHRRFPTKTRVEFIYQFVFTHTNPTWRNRKKLVIRGVGKLNGRYSEHKVYHEYYGDMPTYNQMSFQAIVHVILDGEIRMFNFYDDIFGDSKVFDINGLAIPVMAVTKRAPLLAIDIEEDELRKKEKLHLNEFLQILHGVPIQLKDKNLIRILKIAAKYKVLNVKRYCEQQLIRRDDFEFSDMRKFKMACKYNSNILMNQLLRNVKTVKKLGKLASIANEMYFLDANISKLLIARMYQLS